MSDEIQEHSDTRSEQRGSMGRSTIAGANNDRPTADGVQDQKAATQDRAAQPSAKRPTSHGKTASSSHEDGNLLSRAVEAFKAIRTESKRHAAARDRLAKASETLAHDNATLKRRREIADGYEDITARQHDEIRQAQESKQKLSSDLQTLETEHKQLVARLDQLKADNAEKLRPYKELREATRSRADDAAKRVSETRRAAKTAQTKLSDAKRQRDQGIASANKSVDNARDRLRKVQAELATLQSSPDSNPTALAHITSAIQSEQDQLEAARSEVSRFTKQADADVAEAQKRAWELEESLSSLEEEASNAKKEADARRNEHERLLAQTQQEEQSLKAQVDNRTARLETTKAGIKSANERAKAAQTALDEAEEIHASPEATEELAARVEQEGLEVARLSREVKAIEGHLDHLKASTRSQRIALIVLVLLVIAAIIAVLVVAFAAT